MTITVQFSNYALKTDETLTQKDTICVLTLK